MNKYKAYFRLPFGVMFSIQLQQESKHFTEEQFEQFMRLLARSMGAEYLYCEEVAP